MDMSKTREIYVFIHAGIPIRAEYTVKKAYYAMAEVAQDIDTLIFTSAQFQKYFNKRIGGTYQTFRTKSKKEFAEFGKFSVSHFDGEEAIQFALYKVDLHPYFVHPPAKKTK